MAHRFARVFLRAKSRAHDARRHSLKNSLKICDEKQKRNQAVG